MRDDDVLPIEQQAQPLQPFVQVYAERFLEDPTDRAEDLSDHFERKFYHSLAQIDDEFDHIPSRLDEKTGRFFHPVFQCFENISANHCESIGKARCCGGRERLGKCCRPVTSDRRLVAGEKGGTRRVALQVFEAGFVLAPFPNKTLKPTGGIYWNALGGTCRPGEKGGAWIFR